MPDLKIRSVVEPPPEIAAAADNPRAEAFRKQREQAIAKAQQRAADGLAEGLAESEAADQAPPIEDVESVEVQLPNGHMVLFGPPAVPQSIRIAQMLGAQASSLQLLILSTLLYIKEIDGVPVRSIANFEVDGQALLIRIGGDRALDILSAVLNECWPPLTRGSALPIIKKISRRF